MYPLDKEEAFIQVTHTQIQNDITWRGERGALSYLKLEGNAEEMRLGGNMEVIAQPSLPWLFAPLPTLPPNLPLAPAPELPLLLLSSTWPGPPLLMEPVTSSR